MSLLSLLLVVCSLLYFPDLFIKVPTYLSGVTASISFPERNSSRMSGRVGVVVGRSVSELMKNIASPLWVTERWSSLGSRGHLVQSYSVKNTGAPRGKMTSLEPRASCFRTGTLHLVFQRLAQNLVSITLVVTSPECAQLLGDLFKKHWCQAPAPRDSDSIGLQWGPISIIF